MLDTLWERFALGVKANEGDQPVKDLADESGLNERTIRSLRQVAQRFSEPELQEWSELRRPNGLPLRIDHFLAGQRSQEGRSNEAAQTGAERGLGSTGSAGGGGQNERPRRNINTRPPHEAPLIARGRAACARNRTTAPHREVQTDARIPRETPKSSSRCCQCGDHRHTREGIETRAHQIGRKAGLVLPFCAANHRFGRLAYVAQGALVAFSQLLDFSNQIKRIEHRRQS